MNKEIEILVEDFETKKQQSFTIRFHSTSMDKCFHGVDGDGNIYLTVGWALHKYDQKGNLLAIINVPEIVYEKEGVSVVPMGNVGKIMADGSSYIAYHFADGLRLIKQYIKPGTKGQILKPAVKPEK